MVKQHYFVDLIVVNGEKFYVHTAEKKFFDVYKKFENL
jgi:hypothetical protein